MKLILKNIGMLKSVEINLHPLTLLAGENDNGKSTVGKIVFCIIKAINRYEEDLLVSQEILAKEKIDEFFFVLRSALDTEILGIKYLEISKYLMIESAPEKIFFAKKLLSELNLLQNEAVKVKLDKMLQEAEAILNTSTDKKEFIELAFQKVFAAEFDSRILYNAAQEGSIQLYENSIKLIDLKIDKDNQVELISEVQPIAIKESTFIETPLILNNYDLLIGSRTLLDVASRTRSYTRQRLIGQPYTTLHTKDLFDKLLEKTVYKLIFGEDIDYSDTKISNLIGGEVIFSKEDRDFVYKKESSQEKVTMKNTASGIKTFGLLQMLMQNGMLVNNSMLIFDEPENHLHPKWQLKFAKLICNLVNKGIYVLISSHSPYLVEALQRYSEVAEPRIEAGFYLAKNNQIENKQNLEEIFQLLAQPFDVFEEMDNEALKDE